MKLIKLCYVHNYATLNPTIMYNHNVPINKKDAIQKFNLKTSHLNHFNSKYFWIVFKTKAITMKNFSVNILKLETEGNEDF